MREILFRGKRLYDYVNDKSIDYAEKDDREWVYGDIIHRRYYKNKDVIVIRTEDSGFDNYSDYEVDPSTIGQYTGLTDKNGRKIFEGDCFKTYCAGLPVYKHIVGYYPEHFAFMARCIEMNTVHYLSDYRPSAIEVIGNIHDNPEMLEVTK